MTGGEKRSPLALDREALLAWYVPRRRAYPWRRTRDPYRIWVSEVMLQQTQASRVTQAYPAFIRRFPSLRALAAAPRSHVVSAWDGLGYNRRAVALSEAARTIVREFGGLVPREPAILRRLPGVGPYTAGAVSSLAYGWPVPAVDTNVRRIVARVWFGSDPDDISLAQLAAEAAAWVPRDDPGTWNQALMDLGREICRPSPRCSACPLAMRCRFREAGGGRPPHGGRPVPFEGSTRQVRGAVVRLLRRRPRATLRWLAAETGFPVERIGVAVAALSADGIVRAGSAALAGRSGGSVRLAD